MKPNLNTVTDKVSQSRNEHRMKHEAYGALFCLVFAVMMMPMIGWAQYEVVNDFIDGYYLISNANTSAGTWYVYNTQIADGFVYATSNISINNLWHVSKHDVQNGDQTYYTEGALEKVTNATSIYLCHQGNGTNVRTYKSGQNGSSEQHYRMVLLNSATSGAYVMISHKSSQSGTAGYTTGNATNGGAAFRMDASSTQKQLFPGAHDGEYSSWFFTPQTVTPNVAWPEVTASGTPMNTNGSNWTAFLTGAGTYEYTFASHYGTFWEEQHYLFPNHTTAGSISFTVPSSLPDGVTVTPNNTTGTLTVGIGPSVTGTVSFTVTVTATNGRSVSKSRTVTFTTPIEINSITDINNITDLGAHYVLKADIDGSGLTNSLDNFTGIFEGGVKANGDYYSIRGLTKPLINTLNGGTVRNLVLKGANISGHSGNTGAIACTANGAARIYNCGILSGSVGGTAYTGGLVGFLDGEARVVNCYSYANITSGTNVGGIVGYNNVETKSNNLKTMVFGCMFYGDITGGTNKAPVYNGKIITNRGDNSGVGNFNYFRSEATYVQNRDIQTYHCALSAETRFLQRFEFFRHVLNSHREVAAWWVTGNRADTAQIMKWVMIPDSIGTNHPYPVLKKWRKYPSVVNYTPSTTAYDEAHRNQGRKLTSEGDGGVLHVTIQMGDGAQFNRPHKNQSNAATITTPSLDLTITDKDPAHFNFNYAKVQLPYYNDVGTMNYTDYRVVTGWKIVSITGGTTGTFETGEDVTYDNDGNMTKIPYNFADRNCTNKDLFSVSGRVFNQGAYWDVPEGVTSITIEPYWAKAAYIADVNADVVYNKDMNTQYNVPNVGGGQLYINGSSYNINGESQIVYTNTYKSDGSIDKTAIANAVSGLSINTSYTVNDYAVVLVGNYHQYNSIINDKPYTVTTIDLNGDNEPDYSFMLRFDSRTAFHAVKYDFLNLVGLGMAQKSTEGKGTYNFGIMQPKGWFESTNTSLFRVTQFEYDRNDRVAAPYIVQGGVIEQWVSGQNNQVNNKTIYFHVGGNVWFKEFHLGCHQDKVWTSKHPPISVTGGDFDAFYLTGLYSNAPNFEDDVECYVNGGRFGTVAGTGMEGVGKTSDHTRGNITWLIDHADINEFFAGGINAAKPAEGNINTIISNSYVDFFCGGPKFGDMNTGREVKTTATDCTFGIYFGAGYGGNSYYSAAPGNITNSSTDPWLNNNEKGYNVDWDKWVRGEIHSISTNHGNYIINDNGTITEIPYTGYHNDYISEFGGVSTAIDYQFLPMSSNTSNVARLFLKFVKFSLATTRSVTSTLTRCTIENSFYGGGSIGKVDGSVASVLDGCTVKGNVFGAGYSATLPTVPVMATGGFDKQPYYDKNLGAYLPGTFRGSVNYKWKYRATVNSTATAIDPDPDNPTLFTEINVDDKTNLGKVTGNVSLTLKGNTIVEGHVFGGGAESQVDGNTEVQILGNTKVYGNIYGGGNEGEVGGNTKVIVNGSNN